MKHSLLLSWLLLAIPSIGISQTDSVRNYSQASYFFQPSALPLPKGTLLYNNYYLLVNSVQYSLTGNLIAAGGFSLSPVSAPSLFARIQYSVPVTDKIHIGLTASYYRLSYDSPRRSHLFIPQILLTSGTPMSHGTFGMGLVRGNYWFTDFDGNWLFNLPDQIRMTTSLSYSRQVWRQFHLVTQNHYFKGNNRIGQSEVVVFSLGAKYVLGKSAFKAGILKFYYPKGTAVRFSVAYPVASYSLTIR